MNNFISNKFNLLFGITFLLSSCALPVNQNGNELKISSFNSETNTVNMGSSKGSASVDFNLLINQSDFNTKASTAGVTQGLASDINKVRIILTTSATDPLNPASTKLDTTFTPNSTFSTGVVKRYTISGISTAGTYYVGIQLLKGTDNLVKDFGGLVGQTALSSPFTVTITNGVISSTGTNVTVAAPLRNGVGVKLETSVTHTSGSSSLSAISVY